MNDNEYLVKTIAELLEKGTPVVLASIVSQEGSSPRHTGTKMLIEAKGTFLREGLRGDRWWEGSGWCLGLSLNRTWGRNGGFLLLPRFRAPDQPKVIFPEQEDN